MPQVSNSYILQLTDLEGFNEIAKQSLVEIGCVNVQESKEGSSHIVTSRIVTPTAGWGGYDIGYTLRENSVNINFEINGFISQLSTTPLTKKLDKFQEVFAQKLSNNYGVEFKYEKFTTFMPSNLKFKKVDLFVSLGVISVALLSSLRVDGRNLPQGSVFILTSIAILIGLIARKGLNSK